MPGDVGLFTERINAAAERIQKFYNDYNVPKDPKAVKEEQKKEKQSMWMV